MLPTAKTAKSSSATHGNVDRLPTMIAINEVMIAATQGQRCSKQSSHGASPPQYCETQALPSTAALAARTKSGKRRGSALMTSQIAQRDEPANKRRRDQTGHQHHPALDEVADRLAEPPQQGGDQEKPQTA